MRSFLVNMAGHRQYLRLPMVAKFRQVVQGSRSDQQCEDTRDTMAFSSRPKLPDSACCADVSVASHSSLLSIVKSGTESSVPRFSHRIPTKGAQRRPSEDRSVTVAPQSLRRCLVPPPTPISPHLRPASSSQKRLEPLRRAGSSAYSIMDDWFPVCGDKMKFRLERQFRAIELKQEQDGFAQS